MNRKLKIIVLLFLGFGFLVSYSQNVNAQKKLALFTDRDYCVSGDTVWFKVFLSPELEEMGNVIHVQLDTKSKNLISSVTKKSTLGWAEGYFQVPDSLSTGLCYVTAFLNAQRNKAELEHISKTLLVYNRFEERVNEFETIQTELLQKNKLNKGSVQISTDKNEYQTREKVEVDFGFNTSDVKIKNAVVKANLLDPLAEEIGGDYQFKLASSNKTIPDFVEQDGILVSGKIIDSIGEAQAGELIILSITNDQPYFDYYLSGEEGDFHFFLKNAYGKAKLVLQVISERKLLIQIEDNKLERINDIKTQNKILTSEESDFIEGLINGNFVSKLFNTSYSVQINEFNMQAGFSTPFYGPFTNQIVPDEFIDLPNFKEISRELIPGFQYRTRNDGVTFRLINTKQNKFFDDEPMRLLNGIPVFKNSLFTNLKSTDISKIDIIQDERIFGDLRFKGIIAVSLYDKSNNWMAQQPGIKQVSINCLQLDKKPNYINLKSESANLPDIRQVFFWEKLTPGNEQNLTFNLSDLKGNVEISVEGYTDENVYFKTSKIIKVK